MEKTGILEEYEIDGWDKNPEMKANMQSYAD